MYYWAWFYRVWLKRTVNRMKLDISKVKIITTIPLDNVGEMRNALCDAGAGVIGNYAHCSTSTKCVGTFKPNSKANPYIGENGKLEFVEEEKLEVVCDVEKAKDVIISLRKIHPYEEPAIDIIPLLDENDLMQNN